MHGNLALKATTPWFQRFVLRWDILMLQETHLRPGQEDQLPLPHGYTCMAIACPESASLSHQGGGLLVIYRAHLALEDVTPAGEYTFRHVLVATGTY